MATILTGASGCFVLKSRKDRLSLIVASARPWTTGAIDWSKPLSYIWVVVWALAFAGSLYAIVRLRAVGMPDPRSLPATPKTARAIALFIFILTGVVGLVMFLLPTFGRERWPWDLVNSTNVQLLGAVFLAVSLSSGLSWLQPSWYGYDIFYPTAGTFAILPATVEAMYDPDVFARSAGGKLTIAP